MTASEARSCMFPMTPEGPGCLREVGHEGAHHALSKSLEWTYTACWTVHPHPQWGEAYCLLPVGHGGEHGR